MLPAGAHCRHRRWDNDAVRATCLREGPYDEAKLNGHEVREDELVQAIGEEFGPYQEVCLARDPSIRGWIKSAYLHMGRCFHHRRPDNDRVRNTLLRECPYDTAPLKGPEVCEDELVEAIWEAVGPYQLCSSLDRRRMGWIKCDYLHAVRRTGSEAQPAADPAHVGAPLAAAGDSAAAAAAEPIVQQAQPAAADHAHVGAPLAAAGASAAAAAAAEPIVQQAVQENGDNQRLKMAMYNLGIITHGLMEGDPTVVGAALEFITTHRDLFHLAAPRADWDKAKYALRELPHLLQQNARGVRNVKKLFSGTAIKHGDTVIASFPGIYGKAWNYMTQIADQSVRTTCVFLPARSGKKECADRCLCEVSQRENGLGGGPASEDGCKWWAKWVDNVRKAQEKQAKFLVFHYSGWQQADGELQKLGGAQRIEVEYLQRHNITLEHKSMDDFRKFCVRQYVNIELGVSLSILAGQ